VLSGSSSGPCPDAVASGSIAKAEVRKARGICKACGGPDRTCGGGDDIDPATIGFPSSCPDVTVPHGSSCAASVTDMSGVVACGDDRDADCDVDAAVAVADAAAADRDCDVGGDVYAAAAVVDAAAADRNGDAGSDVHAAAADRDCDVGGDVDAAAADGDCDT